MEDGAYGDDSEDVKMVQVQKKGNIIETSIGKLKETGTVWLSLRLLFHVYGITEVMRLEMKI